VRRELSERADACRLAAVVVELLQISRDPGAPAPPYRCLRDLTRIASVRDTTLARVAGRLEHRTSSTAAGLTPTAPLNATR
jgi:hypothetical protein